MSGVPEIAIGTACDDNGDIIVRLAFALEGAQQCVADLVPEQARQMAGVLNEAADRAEAAREADQ